MPSHWAPLSSQLGPGPWHPRAQEREQVEAQIQPLWLPGKELRRALGEEVGPQVVEAPRSLQQPWGSGFSRVKAQGVDRCQLTRLEAPPPSRLGSRGLADVSHASHLIQG